MPSDDVFDFHCPQCQHRLKAKLGATGRRAKCPKCQHTLIVPAPPTSAPSPATATAPASATAPRPPIPQLPVPQPTAPATPAASATPGSAGNDTSLTAQRHSAGFAPSESTEIPRKDAGIPRKDAEQTPTSSAARPARAIDRTDWLNLGEPAIGDLSERQQLYETNRQAKERARMAQVHKQQSRRRPQGDAASESASSAETPTHLANPSAAKPPAAEVVKRSVFDDDLPELSELHPPSRPSRSIEDLLAAHTSDTHGRSEPLSDLVPDLPPIAKGKSPRRPTRPSSSASSAASDPEYRIACAACGTVQYVRLSQKGKKIQCPDCLLTFPIPAPAPGWKPTAPNQQRESQTDWHSASGDGLQAADSQDTQRSRAARMLEQADQRAMDEDLDRLYEDDFDTADFVQRTFGFLKDPVVLAYIFGNAIVFAGIFAAGQAAANQSNTPEGHGVLLAVAIGAPVIGLLFAMPMLSGGIALIESVANGQRRVADWPSFHLFDNAGDMVAITAALLGAVIPGFLFGSWLGGEDPGAGRIQIAGMMASSLFLFPVFLLSMLDNGSMFAPVSSAVLNSLRQATEAWGGYFLKTLIAFATVLLLWLLLLGEGKPVALAAIAGSLLPLLIFFTCQQIGALAGSISEHLSFEFVPPGDDDNSAEGE